MMQRSIWRALLGALVSAMGGIGLTNSIFPLLALRILDQLSLETLMGIQESSLSIALLWAVAGLIVGWIGGTRFGTLVLALCGAVSGFILSRFIGPASLGVTVLGIAIGLIYAAPGGWIMGYVFPKPVSES
jgi:hypothetical protein